MSGQLVPVLSGAVVALVIRKIAPSPAFGMISDMLLGITGAFAIRWVAEVVTHGRVPAGEYSLVLAVCGAGALPWAIHSLVERFRGQTRLK